MNEVVKKPFEWYLMENIYETYKIPRGVDLGDIRDTANLVRLSKQYRKVTSVEMAPEIGISIEDLKAKYEQDCIIRDVLDMKLHLQ